MDKSEFTDQGPSTSTNPKDNEMVHPSGQTQLMLNKIEMHVEAIQSLVQGHGPLKTSHPFPAISHRIKKIQQVIKEETSNFESNLSSHVQQNMVDSASEVSVFDDTNPCYKALNNSVVLRTIMDYLETKDLLRMRLVAKNWEEEANVQLSSSRRIRLERKTRAYRRHKVTLKWDTETLKFRNKIGTLDDFTENFCNNPLRKFPCSQFHFKDVTTKLEIKEVPADLSNFLTKYGNNITSLSLESSRNSAAALSMIRKIIVEASANLEFLTLDVDLYQDEIPPTETQGVVTRSKSKSKSKSSSDKQKPKLKLSLENLKEMFILCKIPSTCSFKQREPPHNQSAAKRCGILIRDILSSAPNLNFITDKNLWFTKEIEAAGKLGAVQDLEWEIQSSAMMGHFMKFSKQSPQLTSLDVTPRLVDQSYRDGGYISLNCKFPSILLILQSSRYTLRTLSLSSPLDWPEDTRLEDIPVMENVEEFSVHVYFQFLEDGKGRIVPPGFTLQCLFPRLKKLSLRSILLEDPFKEADNSSTTVESLHIVPDDFREDPTLLPYWLPPALVRYPNVRRLILDIFHDWSELPKILRVIWKSWKESLLEELYLYIPCLNHYGDDELLENFPGGMDQAFTGFDKKLCKMLLYGVKPLNQEEEVLVKRGSSILDMKKLKLFKLYVDRDWASLPLFSRVSVIHAFEPMRRRQNLKVLINGDELKDYSTMVCGF